MKTAGKTTKYIATADGLWSLVPVRRTDINGPTHYHTPARSLISND